MLARIDAQEGDLADVERELAVLGLDVVPAALLDLLAQVLELVVAEADRDDLTALEADLDLLCVRHQCPPSGGSTISVSTRAGRARLQEGDAAAADADPRLGVDQLDPARRQLLERRVDVVGRVGDVVQPGARAWR